MVPAWSDGYPPATVSAGWGGGVGSVGGGKRTARDTLTNTTVRDIRP